jgi:uncharacterized repeat protein (TIGR03803 family)
MRGKCLSGYVAFALLLLSHICAHGGESVLHAFCGFEEKFPCGDGNYPVSGMILDSHHNLYGTTLYGGYTDCDVQGCCPYAGCGTIFRISPDGRETVLYPFCSTRQSGCPDGAAPDTRPVFDKKGNLYGTTSLGGDQGDVTASCYYIGCGTVYKIAPSGTETVLYAFSSGSDGGVPDGDLIIDRRGNLYGTTTLGGAFGGDCRSQYGCGTVFELTADGQTETVLHAFQSGSDGTGPSGGLVMDTHGDLFGTTVRGGGTGCNDGGCGILFQLTMSGGVWAETILHAFQGNDGSTPRGVVADASGNLYGTTQTGGNSGDSCTWDGCGTVFKFSQGVLSVLYSFCSQSNCADGSVPNPKLFLDKEGNIYGTTSEGGEFNNGFCEDSDLGCGTVFKIAPDGTETVLYSFCSAQNCNDGTSPYAGPTGDKKGNLYGTTGAGGWPNNNGTVYRLTPQ